MNESKINEKILKYLWNNKISKPIPRKTIHLNRNCDGLNLIESEAHNCHENKTLTFIKAKTQTTTMEMSSNLLTINRHTQIFKRISISNEQ